MTFWILYWGKYFFLLLLLLLAFVLVTLSVSKD
jgi:hypothetical protein